MSNDEIPKNARLLADSINYFITHNEISSTDVLKVLFSCVAYVSRSNKITQEQFNQIMDREKQLYKIASDFIEKMTGENGKKTYKDKD